MDAPKCKLCGERHYGLCPATKGREPKTAEADRQGLPEHGAILPDQSAKTPVSDAPPRAKPKFDRNAYHRTYMREYMKKRRAEKRKEKAK